MRKFLLGLVLLDQVIKYATWSLGWVTINKGIAFGLFPSETSLTVILVVLVFTSLLMKLKLAKNSYKINQAAMLMVAGGLSNMLDRVFYGGVIDYLHLPFVPSFNLADLAITSGFLLVIFNLFT